MTVDADGARTDAVGEPIEVAAAARPHVGLAEWMLLLATVVWGTSFALAKDAGEAINHAAGVGKHMLGPIAVLSLRFSLAALIMLIALPEARRGWTRDRVRAGLITGGLLFAGIALQHVALDRTIEAVAAFLTSLAVIFVPILMRVLFKQRPAPAAYLGVALAVPGVWLMSGGEAATRGLSPGVGIWLGLLAAVLLAGHLIAVGRLTPRVGTVRMCVAQFAVVGLACGAILPLCAIRIEHFDWRLFAGHRVWLDIGLLIAAPTFVSFGLMTRYQPLVSPVRAVMIYLFEPIAAAAFAWLWAGRTMTVWMMLGGALVLVANAIVEILPVVARGRKTAS